VAKATLFAPKPVIDAAPPAKVGNQLVASAEEWGPAPVDTSLMQWYRVKAGKRTPVATDSPAFYRLTAADLGYQMQVAVTGTKPGYTTKTMYSALTAVVTQP
jgi:hypothetical protein